MGWLLVAPLLFFVAFGGFVFLHVDRARAGVAMAAREGARAYGIWRGEEAARARVWEVLAAEGLLSPDARYPDGGSARPFNALAPPRPGDPVTGDPRPVGGVETWTDGQWARVKVTYYLPNPLPRLPALANLAGGRWWPKWFEIEATGAARMEYRLPGEQ